MSVPGPLVHRNFITAHLRNTLPLPLPVRQQCAQLLHVSPAGPEPGGRAKPFGRLL